MDNILCLWFSETQCSVSQTWCYNSWQCPCQIPYLLSNLEMCMISLLTCCMGHAGAPGVLASPFAAMHGLGSPLTSPYGNSAVGGMGGTHFKTLFCSVFFSPLQTLLSCFLILLRCMGANFQTLFSLPSFLVFC